MNYWILFWGIVVLFSLTSFTWMSCKILYKAITELKEMFNVLDSRHKASNAD